MTTPVFDWLMGEASQVPDQCNSMMVTRMCIHFLSASASDASHSVLQTNGSVSRVPEVVPVPRDKGN